MKRILLKFKLSQKLILLTMISITLALSSYIYLSLRDFVMVYKENVAERIIAQASELELSIKDVLSLGLSIGELKGLSEDCIKLVEDIPYAQYCFVMDKEGEVLYHNLLSQVGIVYKDKITQNALKAQDYLVQEYKPDATKVIYDFTLPIHITEGEVISFVRVGVSSEIVDEAIARLRNRAIVLGLIFIFAAGILVFLLYKFSVVKSINKLMYGMNKFGQGDIGARVDLKTQDELGELAINFNKMADDLSLSTTSIKELNREIAERHKVEQALQGVNKDLAENERALKNMLYDLKKSHEELKTAQRQLVQSEKLASIGQLSAGIAHEINNPIGFINSNLSTLSTYIEGLAEVLRALELLKEAVENQNIDKALKIKDQIAELEEKLNIKYILNDIDNLLRESKEGVDRVKKIVMDLKTFSRADQEERSPEDVNKIIEGVLNIVWNEIKYKAELKKEFGQVPLIDCSAQQLGQVFINILVNAAQAIEENGVIIVKTSAEKDKVYVEISDNGKGMSQETMAKIFDPFFTTKEVGQGTGLGLSISYEVIKKHNGEIDIQSEVGKGAKFTVVLPATKV